MAMTSFGSRIAMRRQALGLTQEELARRAEIAQPNLAAIESGARRAGPAVRARLLAAVTARPTELLARHRSAVLDAADRLGVTNVRVFGSVARGDDVPGSDVDLLVALPEHDLADAYLAFCAEAERILTVPVDVIHDSTKLANSPVLKQARAEALPLRSSGSLASAGAEGRFNSARLAALVADVQMQAALCAQIVADGEQSFFEDSFSGAKSRLAAARSYEILAEATYKMHSDFKAEHPEIDWQKIYAMRTKISHHYDKVNDEVLWDVIVRRVPDLAKQLRAATNDAAT